MTQLTDTCTRDGIAPPPTKINATIARHRALVALFYEYATSTEINPATASALEQVITEIRAQGRGTIEALPWYVLDITGPALDALDDMVLEQKIDGLTDFPAAITPMIRNIRRWIIIEKRDRYPKEPPGSEKHPQIP